MQKYLCVEELQLAAEMLKQYAEQLAEDGKTLIRLQNTVKSLWNCFDGILMQLSEYGDEDLLTTAQKLNLAVRQFDYLHTKNFTGLCHALIAFSELLPKNNTVNGLQLAHLANRADYGFYPTDLEHVRMIKKAICFPETEINVLDPCCGEGAALAELTSEKNAVTYGAELSENRAEKATEQLNQVAFGSFFRCKISVGAFHCVFLNPPYLSVMDEFGFRQRMERTFLSQSLPMLANGGLLIYIIPYYRATKEVCEILCKSLDNLRVYRFLEEEFKKFKQVVFLGTKRAKKEAKVALQESDILFHALIQQDCIPLITNLSENRYILPDTPLTVKQFKGSVINQSEIVRMLKASDSAEHLFDNRSLEEREQQPLLPLGVGHIGLIGGSGMMNGLIECATPHVIKGKVVKTYKTEISDSKQETTVRTVNANKMIFNILTPDGFKSLA